MAGRERRSFDYAQDDGGMGSEASCKDLLQRLFILTDQPRPLPSFRPEEIISYSSI